MSDLTRTRTVPPCQIRKWSDPVDNGANLLIAVPGGGDGPGGVLVCSENFIIYKNQDHADVRAVIPRRSDLLADRGVLVVCYATHKKKAYSFFLVQVGGERQSGGPRWLTRGETGGGVRIDRCLASLTGQRLTRSSHAPIAHNDPSPE